MTVVDALRFAAAQFQSESARLDAELLLCHVLGVNRSWLYAWPDKSIEPAQQRRFDELVARRAGGEPIAHILGEREFWSLTLQVTPDTLIPRPDTELLVEQALRLLPEDAAVKVADLGTGSGATALAIARERPRCRVVATDLSAAALAVAQANATRNQLTNAAFRQGSWSAALGYTGIEFVWIPPGAFEMGSPASEVGRSANEALHRVTFPAGFWMSKYEITQGQWMRVTGENPSVFKYAGDQAPVENVDWLAASRFAEALNALGYGAGVRFLLPTEAQWEYACRAGTKTALYTGPLTVKGTLNGPELDRIAWYGGYSGIRNVLAFDTRKWRDRQFDSPYSGTHPVGEKKANAFGLFDMLGNVAEWTAGRYSEDLGTNAVTDPF